MVMKARTLVLLTALAGGCVQAGPEVGVAESALRAHNGEALNGRRLNGRRLNGRSLNGRTLNGSTLEGRTLDGVTLRGGELVGLSGGRDEVRGTDLAGATLEGALDDGTVVTLTIDDVRRHPTLDGAYLYAISFVAAGSEERDWACGLDESGAEPTPILAVPLAGRWDYSEGTATGGDRTDDPDAITLACAGAVLAKCVDMGYAPWRTATERLDGRHEHDVSLAVVHQACTRMLRADYCGDGMSHTQEDVEIDEWDTFGLQVPDRHTRWDFEAEWTADGARCFDRSRLGDGEARDWVDASCPDKWDGWDRNGRACGQPPGEFWTRWGYDAPLGTRSLLMNETSLPAE
jgi:hypothetical protein